MTVSAHFDRLSRGACCAIAALRSSECGCELHETVIGHNRSAADGRFRLGCPAGNQRVAILCLTLHIPLVVRRLVVKPGGTALEQLAKKPGLFS